MSRLRSLSEWIGQWRFPAIPIVVGVALAAPSLFVGLQTDDLLIRSAVLGADQLEGIAPNPWKPYASMDGDPARNHVLVDHGWLPWWTDPYSKGSLSRPLTTLTLMLDYYLWPEHPVLMHMQSLAWYALLIWAAATLYRRTIGHTMPGWVVALATLLYAVDEAHAIPVGWLANRNATIAALFGVLTLIAHDRWRRGGWRSGVWVAPLAFFAALLAKEEAVSTGGYLFAYALFLDRRRWPQRLTSLGPCLLAGLVWYVGYRWFGHGVFASEAYVDPAHDPLRFAGRVMRNGPILLLGQWGFPPSDVSALCSPALFRVHWLWAIGFLSLVWVLIHPLLARDVVARFWCVGMILSILPVCGVLPSDRLLMFAGLGAMGLLAQWLAGVRYGGSWMPASRWWRRAVRVSSSVFLGVHLIVAPLAFPFSTMSMKVVGDALNRVYDTLPNDQALGNQTVVFANSPAGLADVVWIHTRLADGRAVPRRTLNLSPSCSAVSITRTDARTLVVRPYGGYLQPRGSYPEVERPPLVSVRYHAQSIDMVVRSEARPMHLHETIELSELTIEITDMTDDGRPAEATFRFRVPLEDPSLRWLYLDDYRYAPFAVPAVGKTVEVPSPLG